MVRKAPSGVVLRLPDGREAVAKKPTAAGSVTVTGEPVELVLFCFGRQAVAQVDLDGDPEITAQLQGKSFGFYAVRRGRGRSSSGTAGPGC